MHTHYDNLKVARGAPPEVIKAAYRALSQRYHPDRNPGPEAERVMRLLNEAYEVLGEPKRREAYDRELAAHERERPANAGAEARAEPRPGDDATAAGMSAAKKFTAGFATALGTAPPARMPIAPTLGLAVTRCFGRLFDVGWEVAAVGVGVAMLLGAHWQAFSTWLGEPGNPVLFALGCLPVAMVLDASVYCALGNTPGKALLGLKVTEPDGGRLTWHAYVRRNLAVWARGLGFGIPLVAVVTIWRRGREASAGADVVYDMKTGHQVSAAEIGGARKTAFGMLCMACLAAAPTIRTMTAQRVADTAPLPVAMAETLTVKHVEPLPLRASSWTNPLTGNSAKVDGLWRVSASVAGDLDTIYSFTARDGRTTVLFATQQVPSLSMDEYVLSYLQGTAAMMDLAPPDTTPDHVDGVDTWTADGHLTAKPAVAVHVELRRVGQSYWRVVVVRSPQAHIADEAVGKLVQRLWATVPVPGV